MSRTSTYCGEETTWDGEFIRPLPEMNASRSRLDIRERNFSRRMIHESLYEDFLWYREIIDYIEGTANFQFFSPGDPDTANGIYCPLEEVGNYITYIRSLIGQPQQ